MRRRHALYSYPHTLHFVTTVTAVRGKWFVEEAVCTRILKRFESCLQRFGLDCCGYVLMPDHIHTLLRQVEEGLIISKFMQAFKRETSAYARPKSYTASSLWLPHFDDVPIPNSKAAATRLSYMNYNPLRRGLADEVEKYLWSSARDYAGAGHGIVTVTNPFTGEVFGPGRAAEA